MKTISNSMTMCKRCVLLAMRNLDALFAGFAQPVLLMILFVYVFGNSLDVGVANYVNFIVPGVILQCIGQCSTITAIGINNDMKNGIIDRFHSMPITRSSVLIGHALAAIIRNVITMALAIGAAYLIGFRPTADLVHWLLAIGILLLYIIAITWLSIIFGLISGSAESAQMIAVVTIMLPYLSSGFVTTQSMPTALRAFAENQPLTPIIESTRSLLMNSATDGKLILAIMWCVGILVVSYVIATQIYKVKLGSE
ncbi:MAG: ABC transporter permease [Lachnospiraceae bacterium]